MQWDKVKNTLLVILLAVNLFLVSSLGAKVWQDRQHAAELEANLRTLAAGYGLTLDGAFELPRDRTLPQLTLDRSRADEEAAAAAMLGEDMSRTEQEDGTVRFESEAGTLEWRADGTVEGMYRIDAEAPAGEEEALRTARALFKEWGLLEDGCTAAADGQAAVLTGTVAGMPVHNRQLTLRFGGDGAALSGLWSFGTPYTTARESGVFCAASDALLAFAAEAPEGARIISMTAGYRLQADSSRRLQFTPTWKIVTDSDEYLVDCAKKAIVASEN